MNSQEAQCILILDLASDNPITERSIERFLPPADYRRAYYVSQYGAQPASQGGAPDRKGWRAWTAAVDRMLEQARKDLGADREIAHYYAAGRAALPIFAYLGLRLGKQARITAINARPNGEWDVVPFQRPLPVSRASEAGSNAALQVAVQVDAHVGGADASPPRAIRQSVAMAGAWRGRFFDQVKGLALGFECQGTGKVAVFVSTQADLEPEKVRDLARRLHCPLAGIVTVRAKPIDSASGARKWLGGADGPGAAEELEEIFTAVKDCYPCYEGLMVFIAGPAPLALMVGWAVNPRIYTPVWLPYFRDGAYQPAVEVPWPLSDGVPTVLIATANPPDEENQSLDIERELSYVLKILEQEVGAGRCVYHLRPAVDLDELQRALHELDPHILHFSGHSEVGGLWLRNADGASVFVSAAKLKQIIRTTAKRLRLIVLCSCRSAPQAELLKALVDCTVGTTADVLDEAAIAFSRRFYEALTHGSSVQLAFDQGKARAETRAQEGHCRFELFHRDGVDPRQVVLFSPANRTS